MKKVLMVTGGVFLSFSLAGASQAGSFEESLSKCLIKHANTRDAAMVMLECTAADGKLSACKVLEDSKAGKGFDKAALCVADALPMGARTGVVKVPMRFPGGG